MREEWKKRKLGDVIALEYGKPLPKNQRCQNKEFPAYGANGIKCYAVKPFCDDPSIIVGRKGTAGAVNLVDGGFWPLDVTYYVTFDEDQYDLKFLYYMLSALDLPSLATGVKPGINRNAVYAIDQYFPPLPEQKCIVAILDEAFAGIATAVANTEKNLANACELFESYLNAAFKQQADGWVRKALQEVTTKIGSGATPRGGQSAYKDKGISLIRSLNVHDRRFKLGKLAFIDDAQAGRLSNAVVEDGDVLFNITGASIARCCVAPSAYLPARVNQHVSILRPLPSELDSDFLCYLMTARIYKDHLLGIGDEGGSTRQAITKSQLQNLVIALPNRAEQIRIVAKLKSIEAETQQLERYLGQKLTALDELKQSLLQKAFSGELTAKESPNRILKEEEVA